MLQKDTEKGLKEDQRESGLDSNKKAQFSALDSVLETNVEKEKLERKEKKKKEREEEMRKREVKSKKSTVPLKVIMFFAFLSMCVGIPLNKEEEIFCLKHNPNNLNTGLPNCTGLEPNVVNHTFACDSGVCHMSHHKAMVREVCPPSNATHKEFFLFAGTYGESVCIAACVFRDPNYAHVTCSSYDTQFCKFFNSTLDGTDLRISVINGSLSAGNKSCTYPETSANCNMGSLTVCYHERGVLNGIVSASHTHSWAIVAHMGGLLHKRADIPLDSFDDPSFLVTYDGKKAISYVNKKNVSVSCILDKAEYKGLASVGAGKTETTTLPLSAFILSGSLTVKCYAGGSLIEMEVFDIVAVRNCDIRDCVNCFELWEDVKCLPPSIQWLLLSVGVLLLLFTIAFFPCIKDVLRFAGWLMVQLLRSMWRMVMMLPRTRLMKRIRSKWGMTMKSMSKELEVEEEDEPTAKTDDSGKYDKLVVTRGNGFRPKKITGAELAILLLFISVAAGCTDGGAISGSLTNCASIDGGKQKNCSLTINTLFNFKRPGEKVCFFVKDEDGTIGARVNISLLAVERIYPLSKLYYTSSYKVETTNTFRCQGAGPCTEYNCLHVGPDSNAYNQLSGASLTWPGTTVCEQGCSGGPFTFKCGCGYDRPGCIFSRAAVIPTGEIMLIDEILEPSEEIYIRFEVAGNNLTSMSFDTKIGYNPVMLDKVSLSFSGQFSSRVESFKGKKLGQAGGVGKIVSACEANSPKAGTLGDIQANSESNLKIAGQNAFTMDRGSIIRRLGTSGTELSYAAASPGYNANRGNEIVLPGLYGGVRWYISGSALLGNVTEPGTTQFTFKSTEPISLVFDVKKICPKFTIKRVEACVGCQEKSKLVISAKSTCAPGSVELTVNNNVAVLATKVIDLTDVEADHDIFFSVNSKSGDFELTMSSPTSKVSNDVSFVAIERDNIVKGDQVAVFDKMKSGTASYDDSLSFDMKAPKVDLNPELGFWDKVWLTVLFGNGWVSYVMWAGVLVVLTFGGVFIFKVVKAQRKRYLSLKKMI